MRSHMRQIGPPTLVRTVPTPGVPPRKPAQSRRPFQLSSEDPLESKPKDRIAALRNHRIAPCPFPRHHHPVVVKRPIGAYDFWSSSPGEDERMFRLWS